MDTDILVEKPRTSFKTFWVLGICVLVIVGLVLYGLRAPKTFPEEGATFTVKQGEHLGLISTRLKNEGFIRSRVIFASLVTLFGLERKIGVGDYYMEKPLPVTAIARRISQGQHGLSTIKVTIPEGYNNKEIALLLENKLPEFSSEEFLTLSKEKEGYLFPNTYFFFPSTTAEEVLARMTDLFEVETKDIQQETSSWTDIVIMASLIEREAKGDDDRALIAGILYNRLNEGMRLQVDATVAYAAGVKEGELLRSMFDIDSPYNTYRYGGLPPGPIANPGLLSLQAASNPEPSDYLYYLHDKRGSIHYAKTFAQHQANIERYLR